MNNLIPNFITSKKPKSSPSSSSSSFSPPSQPIKPKKCPSPHEEEVAQVNIPMPLAPPSTPSLPPPSFASSLLERELEDSFQRFDADGDGQISPAEIASLLQCLGDKVSEEEAMHIVRDVDKNGDGFVDLHEFIDLFSRPHSPPLLGHSRAALEEEEEELQCAFHLFDKDENGFISAEELHEMLHSLGERDVSLQDCYKMIQYVDHNKDGVVDFEEFKAMMIVTASA